MLTEEEAKAFRVVCRLEELMQSISAWFEALLGLFVSCFWSDCTAGHGFHLVKLSSCALAPGYVALRPSNTG